MYCPKCGDPIEQNEIYCNKCGNYLGNIAFNTKGICNKPNNSNLNKNKSILIGVGSGICLLVIIFVGVFVFNRIKNKYYFSSDSYNDSNAIENKQNQTTKHNSYDTIIVTDNTYLKVDIKNKNDAKKLIVKDSVSQKDKCPTEIREIEDEFINKYNIIAVNLCEMDVDFAKELGSVLNKIYNDYPDAKGYITNLSLINSPISESFIAQFMPIFNFATSNSKSTYPWVIKTQVFLNTRYFFNRKYLDTAMKEASNTGHFPPNSTVYSPLAHEMGHFLSFLTVMKKYESNSILLINDSDQEKFYKIYADFGEGDNSLEIIKEAYNKYKLTNNTDMSIDDWRSTISGYAVAKDNSGNYIYDETIAEAFHDVYLNGDNAKDASKYIIAVLKEKLGGGNK